ncbi:uncharacterized protein LOC131234761 isoform X2 [Magnolia sinica]|uniref:uncharacterized protein LOC131234761 isoform X2 n=1 Tax=Magnolia sinica TaxID=86752 RepID=UPI00265A4A47|nr:uncharacterized protein LOC131234761 isoform X2 [Magnolia sinica]XP_058087686.1 uncharacterized protein LOC131234761 isoform X2 [Magnolia sinica]
MVTHACKLSLPQAHPTSVVSSLLFEPTSNSLALMCTDSSVLLHHPISLSSPPSPSPSPSSILIPPPSTSASFLRLHPSPDPAAARVVFLAAGPHRSSVLLRAWILRRTEGFAHAQLNIKNGNGKSGASGAILDLSHGFSIKVAGSINVVVVYSASAGKIWVLSARLVDWEDGRTGVDLMKCGVIECTVPICSVFASAGFLFLGQENGVRVFPLRPIVKGRLSRKERDLVRRRVKEDLNGGLLKNRVKNLKNGVIQAVSGNSVIYRKNAGICCNGDLEGVLEDPSDGSEGKAEADYVSAKHKTVKLRQDSGELGSLFVAFKVLEVERSKSKPAVPASLKAVSIHALSRQRFLILDSVGDVHLLSLNNIFLGSELTKHSSTPFKGCHMRRLECTMKVQMLAVLPDISTRTQTVWLSDGCHSVHMTSVADMDAATVGESDKKEEKLMQISAIQAIFTSEKIHDIIPYAANGILILGQGNFCIKPA